MDLQTFINLGAGTLLTVAGWFVREARTEQKITAKALQDFQVKVAEEYVKHSALDDIKESLRRIEDRLNARV